jgi:hypothetical protein
VTARVRVAALRVAAVLVLALGALATCAPVARAAGTNHALVVVEANGSVVQRVVTFGSDSISGLTALQQAGFAPVVRGFGGMGGAVCAIDMPTTGQTVGCPADNTCLTCAGSSFWAYFEAPSGTSSFRQSRAGAARREGARRQRVRLGVDARLRRVRRRRRRARHRDRARAPRAPRLTTGAIVRASVPVPTM